MALFSLVHSWIRRLQAGHRKTKPLTRTRLGFDFLERREVLDATLGTLTSRLPVAPPVFGPVFPQATTDAVDAETNRSFVTGLYYDLLHRQPQLAEVDGWAQTMGNGMSRGQVLQAFLGSSEYRGGIIQDYYTKFLGREAEPIGIIGWLAEMHKGKTFKDVSRAIISSDEYLKKSGGKATDWVTRVYNDVLDRAPDAAGLASWSQKGITPAARDAVTRAILDSQESSARLVQEAYEGVLGRSPDPQGFSFWVGALQNGLSQERLPGELAGSSEYLAQQAGFALPVLGEDESQDQEEGDNVLPDDELPPGVTNPDDQENDGNPGSDDMGGSGNAGGNAGGADAGAGNGNFVGGSSTDNGGPVLGGPAVGGNSGSLGGNGSIIGGGIIGGGSGGAGGSSGVGGGVVGGGSGGVIGGGSGSGGNTGGGGGNTGGGGSGGTTGGGTTGGDAGSSGGTVISPGSGGDSESPSTGRASITAGPVVDMNRQRGQQSECTIAIDPSNPLRLFTSSNENDQIGLAMMATSKDGGKTWTSRFTGNGSDGLPSNRGDPWAFFDEFGNLFYTYLNDPGSGNLNLIITLSTDGGSTFRVLATLPAVDHPEVAAGQGTVAVTWVDSGGGGFTGYQIVVASAAVTGLGQVGNFTTVVVPGAADLNFGDIAIGPTGQILITMQEVTNQVGPSNIYVSVDPDGVAGPQGFGTARVIGTSQIGWNRPIPAQPTRNILVNLGLAYDRSNGANRGTAYIVYADAANTTTNDTNIMLRSSKDNGRTWSTAVKVNDDTTSNSQFFPKVAVDQSTGTVGLSWYDCRLDQGGNTGSDTDGVPNTDVDVFATVSRDGGKTFEPNIRVTAASSNATRVTGNPFNEFGDYTGLAFHGGKMFPAWADNSRGLAGNPDGSTNMDIVTSEITVPGGGTAPTGLQDDSLEPNDTSDKARNLGTAGSTRIFTNLTINKHANGLQDYDWYKFAQGSGTTFVVNVDYKKGATGDLNIRVFTVKADGTLVQVGSSRNVGVTSQRVGVKGLLPGTPILVWVYGFDFATGTYDMTVGP